jgi:hypothetical protein
MRILGLERYRDRGRHQEGRFAHLPPTVRRDAERWLWRLCKPWHERRDLPPWRYAILCGQASRLALNPPTSAWGYSMLAKRGGYAVQRKYRAEGRTGLNHPAHKAADYSAGKRRSEKQEREKAEQRERLGLPPEPRVWRRPLA